MSIKLATVERISDKLMRKIKKIEGKSSRKKKLMIVKLSMLITKIDRNV